MAQGLFFLYLSTTIPQNACEVQTAFVIDIYQETSTKMLDHYLLTQTGNLLYHNTYQCFHVFSEQHSC